jgi:hypothetical protein
VTASLVSRMDDERSVDDHVLLICRLERLADLGLRAQVPAVGVTCGACSEGEVVLVKAGGYWRYAVAVLSSGQDAARRWVLAAYLSATALDAAQRTWGRTSREVLAVTYPEQASDRARREHPDPSTADDAGVLARKRAARAQAVARGCPRRPWAAVVPPRYVRRATDAVYRPVDQALGTHGRVGCL